MKIDPRQATRFAAELASGRHPCRALLLYGDDPGLIRERADAAIAATAFLDAVTGEPSELGATDATEALAVQELVEALLKLARA